jgi:alpha-glucoside transport system substrate-binding protein
MQLRRSRAGFVLFATASIVFGACSSGASPSPAAPSSGASAPAGASATAGGSPAASGGTSLAGQKVTIIATWTGDEQKAFMSMVAPWEQQTGAKVSYTGTRDINTILATGVASGVLPDLAGLPGPGQMQEYYKAGALKTLDDVLDIAKYKSDTAPALVQLGSTPDGKIGGVFIKAAVKGLIWYSPKLHDYASAPPKTWTDLNTQAQANKGNAKAIWCVGVESGAASGWPGTDWIEDFVLRQSGPDVYDDWVAGKIPWTSPEIKSAFEMYGTVVADAAGGSTSVIATDFQDGGDGLFSEPPSCLFHHQATFMTEFFKSQAGAREGEYDFFPFPAIDERFANDVTGAGDLFGMFRDTPQARSLMSYLVTPEAQSIWVARGGALSVNVNVTTYPDDISKRAAQILTSADRFRFDASDLMPEQLNEAFLRGVIDFTRDQTALDSIQQRLDDVSHSTVTGPQI